MRSSVDLPQPEGPTSTTNSPSSMETSTPWTTSWRPNALRTRLSSTEAMALSVRAGGTPARCARAEATTSRSPEMLLWQHAGPV